MDIRICSYLAASDLLEHEPDQWDVIVVLDSDKVVTDFVKTTSRSLLVLCFDDIVTPLTNKRLPTEYMLQQGLAFSEGKEKLLISCRAGQSRSTALAYLIDCQERGASEAIKLINPKRHIPNPLIVTSGGTLLDSYDVIRCFDDWRQRNSHIVLSDYYNEIEHEIDILESQGASNTICIDHRVG